MRQLRSVLMVLPLLSATLVPAAEPSERIAPRGTDLLSTEKVTGDGVWLDPRLKDKTGELRVTVWFDEQLLGAGDSYPRRAKELAGRKRRELRAAAIKTLQELSQRSHQAAAAKLQELEESKTISGVERHWIINGFTCHLPGESVDELTKVPGVKKVFLVGPAREPPPWPVDKLPKTFPPVDTKFDPGRYKHPWYTRYLLADRVWRDFHIAGGGTLNVIHDFNFVMHENLTPNLYRNPAETPGNQKDDDGNGLVDDYHGYNFANQTATLAVRDVEGRFNPQLMHGSMCAAIICGTGAKGREYEFGLAPEGRWAGIIGGRRIEASVEWAVLHGADTYSMSFSQPGLADYRSHWRKVMEHGALCGLFFVSGAGNFAQSAKIPVQMRVPEDIPGVVFAAAGVQRNLARTPFSSQGPVEWLTEHYHDGRVAKPEVCAFNAGLPALLDDGQVREGVLNGNSFAGPMFCGSLALMVSADPDLLPWDAQEIITSTATDVAADGVDDQTGHGLINCYRAVKEVLRRRAVREGRDATPYTGRVDGDELNVKDLAARLARTQLLIGRVQAGSQASQAGLKPGDVIVSYHKQPISNRAALQQARKQVEADQPEEVALVVQRDGKQLTMTLKPGPLGIFPVEQFAEPTFK